ncbi:MAG: hypothetical protein ACKVVT_11060 [Dehalococcoidia bacterium]
MTCSIPTTATTGASAAPVRPNPEPSARVASAASSPGSSRVSGDDDDRDDRRTPREGTGDRRRQRDHDGPDFD